jgi:hypothetical protein
VWQWFTRRWLTTSDSAVCHAPVCCCRRVQEQTDNPMFGSRGRPMYGSGEPGFGQPAEWDPFRPGDDSFEKKQVRC